MCRKGAKKQTNCSHYTENIGHHHKKSSHLDCCIPKDGLSPCTVRSKWWDVTRSNVHGFRFKQLLGQAKFKSKSIYDLMWREVIVHATRAALVMNYVIPDNSDYDKWEMATIPRTVVVCIFQLFYCMWCTTRMSQPLLLCKIPHCYMKLWGNWSITSTPCTGKIQTHPSYHQVCST